jgi:hypothetical protein
LPDGNSPPSQTATAHVLIDWAIPISAACNRCTLLHSGKGRSKSDPQSVIERAVELAGGVEALASVLSIPASRVEGWIGGSEAVPRYAKQHLSRRIAQAERAASRLLERIDRTRPQARQ